MRTNVPIVMRKLRIRRRWRQEDLGARARLSRDAVSRAECGQLDGLTIRTLSRLVEALDASLVIEIRWQGADLDRLIDRDHAYLQDMVARRLMLRGWTAQVEVSFNHYGDRGSCDLVAWHSATQTLLVVEVKSRLGNLQDLLHRLDVKARLGGVLARQLGWSQPRAVVRALVVAEDRTARRILARHSALLSAYDVRGRAAAAWLRAPTTGVSGLLWFEDLTNSDGGRITVAERVRNGPHEG